MIRPITPPDLADLMRRLTATAADAVEVQRRGASIMAETLRRLGYDEGVGVWERGSRT